MISRSRFFGLFFSICLGAGCASGLGAGTNGQGLADPASAMGGAAGANLPGLARPADDNDPKSDSARALSPNDGIIVTVYQEDDLTTKTIIDKNGMVMLPLLGQVKISGLSVRQATELIQQLYDKDYLVKPQVNVIVEHFAERRFSVLGQVQKPDSFDFPQNETVNLLEAIAKAGGYTRLGAPTKVDVRRVENGTPKIYHFDAGAMAKDPKKKPFEILPGDIITVGEKNW